MAIYHVLNAFFFVFHSAFILFVLFGWIPAKTRKAHLAAIAATAFSWFILGIWYGFGYCPCTEWHWRVRYELGLSNMPYSYIKFLVDRITGGDHDENLVNTVTVSFFVIVAALSVYLNVRAWRRRATKDGNEA
ncbi:MAG TPA: DUF2784 domain-containing protein [Candidatus Hydrogenedentes bacterium]|nr:DUF2784 domain-containing protein [Candidatus Hydrogenedentota bacterium]HPG65554.1 DUF2784 domain-containing protein [Candidatus Hydrogenedentota bacterium]